MIKVNIREALLTMDKDTCCKYDLYTLYEACNLSECDKKEIAKMIADKDDPDVIYDKLVDKFGEQDFSKIDDDVSDIKESWSDDLIDSQYQDDISDGHWSWDYDDDELANIYGGDTKYDENPDGLDIDESATDSRDYKMVEYNYDGDDISNYLGHVRVRTNSDKVALRAAEKYAMSKHPEDNPGHFKIVDDNYTNVDVVDSDGDYLTTMESVDKSVLGLIRSAIKGNDKAIRSLKYQGYKVNKLINPLHPREVGTYVVTDTNGTKYNYDNTFMRSHFSVSESVDNSELEIRKQNYLKAKEDFETLGEKDNNDVLSREEKMLIAKAEYEKVLGHPIDESLKEESSNNGWVKRWNFLDKYYKDDLVISKISSPVDAWHIEKVAPNGHTIKHVGNYRSLEAAMDAAEKYLVNESKSIKESFKILWNGRIMSDCADKELCESVVKKALKVSNTPELVIESAGKNVTNKFIRSLVESVDDDVTRYLDKLHKAQEDYLSEHPGYSVQAQFADITKDDERYKQIFDKFEEAELNPRKTLINDRWHTIDIIAIDSPTSKIPSEVEDILNSIDSIRYVVEGKSKKKTGYTIKLSFVDKNFPIDVEHTDENLKESSADNASDVEDDDIEGLEDFEDDEEEVMYYVDINGQTVLETPHEDEAENYFDELKLEVSEFDNLSWGRKDNNGYENYSSYCKYEDEADAIYDFYVDR